jgi:hypothetical protein
VSLPFRNAADPRRLRDSRPDHQERRRPHLPDDRLRLRRRRPRLSAVPPAGVRQHLQPHHEPDERRAREARRGARGRRHGARRGVRSRGRVPRHRHARAGGRQHRVESAPLRRHGEPLPGHAAAAGDQRPLHRSRPTPAPSSPSSSTSARAPSSSSRSPTRPCGSPTSDGIAAAAHAHGRRGARRQHRRHGGLPLPPDRARRGRRRALGDEVDQWARHERRGRARRRRHLGLGQRALCALHRPEPLVRRPELLEDLRHRGPVRQHRVRDPRSRRGPARPRRRPRAA